MVLREILTHQGGSAGVFMPDLSLDGALDELKDIDYSSSMKREREFDLNMQVLADESEPDPKRQKFEDLSTLSMDMMVSTGNCGNFDISVKVDESEWNLPAGQVNGQVDVTSVKVEPESCPDVLSYSSEGAVDLVESKDCCDDKGSFVKSDILNNLPENCELMNLVKLARHSWIKNSEFLQDCAIRFLCILSLDRYGFNFCHILLIIGYCF